MSMFFWNILLLALTVDAIGKQSKTVANFMNIIRIISDSYN
jgi:hypothetical protein